MWGLNFQVCKSSVNNSKIRLVVIVVCFFAFLIPFFMNIAGDAQVHLAIAESFVKGYPFRYNQNGPIVVASTSPFWTLTLILFFSIFGYLTPVALKILTFLLWITTVYLLYKIARDIYKLSNLMLLFLMAVYATCTAVVVNALGGLENILSSVQLLLLYLVSIKLLQNFKWKRTVIAGLLLGWTVLTRPDAGLLGMAIILLLFASKAVSCYKSRNVILQLLLKLILVGFAAIAVCIPWYVYQYHITGSLITDSSFARLYAGRRGSFELIKGCLYFHPKAMVTIATVFFPVFIGFIIASAEIILRFKKSSIEFAEKIRGFYAEICVILLLICGLFFYSFVVGADHFGRYFLPVFPFFFVFGFKGQQLIYDWVSAKNKRLAWVCLIIIMGFLFLGNGLDYYRRIVKHHQFNYDLFAVVKAPLGRQDYTDNYLKKLALPLNSNIKIAVMEVQLRYFVDDRVTVESLDGRTSNKILDYIDKNSGIPDFARYLEDEKPTYVELGQWCGPADWMSLIFPIRYRPNLMCQWQNKVRQMEIGQSFNWKDRQVKYVAPGKVRIEW